MYFMREYAKDRVIGAPICTQNVVALITDAVASMLVAARVDWDEKTRI